MPLSGLDDRLVGLAPLLEQVIHQAARPHLALVALEHVSAAEKARHSVANASAVGRTAWIANVPDGAVETAFQTRRTRPRNVSLPAWTPESSFAGQSAGTGWAHVNALRRKGVDARLLVFWPQKWRPDEYDINLDLPRQGMLRQRPSSGARSPVPAAD